MTLKKLRANDRMKQIMAGYYMMGNQAEVKGWITSGAPVELLYAMDIYPVYPENHGALIGAAKQGPYFSDFAERKGFSRDLCSYARCDIGCVFAGTSPIGGLPEPTFLFACNNICNTVVKWYEVLSRIFKVPLFVLDTPFVRKELKESYVKYVHDQLYEFVDFLEKTTGRELSDSKLRDTVIKSIQGVKAYAEVLGMARHKPSPLTCFDAFINMAPIVCLRGTDYPVQFYAEMKEELEERVKRGEGAIENEEIRLLWDNIPVWYRLKWFSEFFAERNACLVADTYTNAWTGFISIDKSDIFWSMAETYTFIYLNIGLEHMAEAINRLIDYYDVDGAVIHSNRSCKPYSFGQYELQKMIEVPSVIIEADMVDSRTFSEAQVETRLEAFLEMLR
ncbi:MULTISPECIES: 2-hydroxyacyl-CoA dehydratase subunit D [Archaeoglobus]|jgi:benzoyl-CoA reductase/2-hydroxyglutaryl-CoA dehydratase subunit BcrC/BadD/HgdB|uniref:2-hydroxyglutaryl-CoA dehydratase, subunit alpha (HgdA) n=3 Tax=Archaeoglobus fulgidus TaxID=2234 RepID=O28321_ARCFU|nr:MULTISPECIES: 2-hydroxyacyl-CoA dehydratase subunit D [Archaeoglobus]AAB89297.1 2-hydroxyglutaryl-CoA dehydratase, subunit alpha (hgdA) [Archaeoglobus fulgidus DSM 4304]AIG98949.1 Benzoyl-CoA reductase/2-hydroxyglutaryl-CoA dehydratase, alpha subunit [Archaeoglobus fulgidus DSM 8774]KUJ93789.1 MAG: 2-hydroxyglutaryl-CoA dehydratase, subunit alpha (HgdA) [Archaeoglobus fulgidus]KUK06629.1 MAG: 2-hydroxyglutaryl-CoA dehydratase, subunit alpha (HgdA) [Archaeoglobus fulgidus]MDI3498334.1 hypoth